MFQKLFRSKQFKTVQKLMARVLKHTSSPYARRIRLTETTFTSLSFQRAIHFHVEDKKTGARRPLGTFEDIDYNIMHQALQEILEQIRIYENSNLTASQKRLLPYVHGKKKPLFDVKSPEGSFIDHKTSLMHVISPEDSTRGHQE